MGKTCGTQPFAFLLFAIPLVAISIVARHRFKDLDVCQDEDEDEEDEEEEEEEAPKVGRVSSVFCCTLLIIALVLSGVPLELLCAWEGQESKDRRL